MKKIFLLSLSIFILAIVIYAQENDTLEIHRDKIGYIDFARFKNSDTRKFINGNSFLIQTLKASLQDDFKLSRTDTDEYGITHQRYQQYYKGVKVEGGEYSLHGKNGNVEIMNGHYKNVSLATVTPSISEEQSLTTALNLTKAHKYKWEDTTLEQLMKQKTNNRSATYYPTGELLIMEDSLHEFQLAWRFVISTLSPDDEILVIINAISGI